jgi:hypothetical protein
MSFLFLRCSFSEFSIGVRNFVVIVRMSNYANTVATISCVDSYKSRLLELSPQYVVYKPSQKKVFQEETDVSRQKIKDYGLSN